VSVIQGTAIGTTSAPTLVPELKIPVASARSFFGNHSATVYKRTASGDAAPLRVLRAVAGLDLFDLPSDGLFHLRFEVSHFRLQFAHFIAHFSVDRGDVHFQAFAENIRLLTFRQGDGDLVVWILVLKDLKVREFRVYARRRTAPARPVGTG
jgi:hypothetical protein